MPVSASGNRKPHCLRMIKLLQYIRIYWLACTAVVFTGIPVLSLWPLEALPAVPGTDKNHHIIAYAVLMFPTALRRPTSWKSISLFFILYSGLIELVQPYVNRYTECFDMAANITGVVCGLLVGELIIRLGVLQEGGAE